MSEAQRRDIKLLVSLASALNSCFIMYSIRSLSNSVLDCKHVTSLLLLRIESHAEHAEVIDCKLVSIRTTSGLDPPLSPAFPIHIDHRRSPPESYKICHEFSPSTGRPD